MLRVFATILILVLLLAAWFWWLRNRPYPFPDASVVTDIHVSLDLHPQPNQDFQIRPEHFSDILNMLSDHRPEFQPKTWIVLGRLNIKTDQETTAVSLFRTKESEGAFRVGTKYFRGPPEEHLINAFVEYSE